MSETKRGMLFILSGPSGSGKDTILEQLAKRDPNVQLSISLTTARHGIGRLTGSTIILSPKIIS